MDRPIIATLVTLVTTLGMAGCAGAPRDPYAIPDSPDGTVRVAVQAFADQRPEVFWRALPPSYQADVNALLASFGENMDPAVFDRSVAVLRKAAVVLQRKKDVILSMSAVRKTEMDPAVVDTLWEGAMSLINTLLASDLARLEAYATFDVDAFLAGTGAELMAHAAALPASGDDADGPTERFAEIGDSEVELVSQDGDHAVVRVVPADEEAFEIEMTRVEQRWLPDDLVEEWPDAMHAANERIEQLGSEEAAQLNIQLLFAVGVAEGLIDQIDEMESPEDLDKLVGPLVGSAMQSLKARVG